MRDLVSTGARRFGMMVGMNSTANTRRAQRKERRRRERADRWQHTATAARWTDPDTEPSPSEWGRWTPPKRWRENYASVLRFTRGQIAYIADLFTRAFPNVGPEIVTVVRLDGPPDDENSAP